MTERIYTVLLALLVGSQAAVGYLVAPTVFEVIADRGVAGTIAGAIFERTGWMSLAILIVLLILRWRLHQTQILPSRFPSLILITMLGLTALGHFMIRPWIGHIRFMIQQSGGFEMCEPAMRNQFGMLHGISSILFLLVFLLGLSLLWRLKESLGQSKSA